MMFVVCAISTQAEEPSNTTRLDATTGNPGKYEITYLTIADPKKSPQKTVAVILTHSTRQDLIYAYQIHDKTATLKLLSQTKLGTPKTDNPNLSITTVKVTKAQYQSVKTIIKTHIETADKTDGPEIRFYNCISQVLRACNMKIPYRSAYRAPNPTQWINDIPAYSLDILLQTPQTNK